MIKKIEPRNRKHKFIPKEMPDNFQIDWLIDDLFPKNEVHLVGGPSGAGKTTLLFQTINDLKDGKPVFGSYSARNLPFIYAACDRSCANMFGTMQRVKAKFPIISIPEVVPAEDILSTNYTYLIPDILEDNPQAKILFIDGMATVLPQSTSVNDYSGVHKLLTFLLKMCQQRDVTIFGIVHSTKVKEDEKFLNPREKILGSVAWAAFSDTIAIVESVAPNREASMTQVNLLPRNTPHKILTYEHNENGQLMLAENAKEAGSKFVFMSHLEDIPGTSITRAMLDAFGEKNHISSSTITRLIKVAMREKLLKKDAHGCYLVRGAKEAGGVGEHLNITNGSAVN